MLLISKSSRLAELRTNRELIASHLLRIEAWASVIVCYWSSVVTVVLRF